MESWCLIPTLEQIPGVSPEELGLKRVDRGLRSEPWSASIFPVGKWKKSEEKWKKSEEEWKKSEE